MIFVEEATDRELDKIVGEDATNIVSVLQALGKNPRLLGVKKKEVTSIGFERMTGE